MSPAERAFAELGLDHIDFLVMKIELRETLAGRLADLLESFGAST